MLPVDEEEGSDNRQPDENDEPIATRGCYMGLRDEGDPFEPSSQVNRRRRGFTPICAS